MIREIRLTGFNDQGSVSHNKPTSTGDLIGVLHHLLLDALLKAEFAPSLEFISRGLISIGLSYLLLLAWMIMIVLSPPASGPLGSSEQSRWVRMLHDGELIAPDVNAATGQKLLYIIWSL